MKAPYDDLLDNPGQDDHWTTPCCYHELYHAKSGIIECPKCGRKVKCSIIQQPVCRAELVEDQTE